ncbi:stage V sporulation protein SpoVM [Alicyclobacillus pomorum]|uniref:stage V sporulation protein SpoVM n=1 Tax=Alicyclobacillus pomorum TaxID=204470 RepID=UPI000A0015D0
MSLGHTGSTLCTYPDYGNIYVPISRGIIVCVPMVEEQGGEAAVKFYTIKLPRFVGGIVKACIGVFSRD